MFKHLVWISAIAIALCAAFFSVTGIATLFAGKFWSVLAMAAALEVGKLVAVSFLYRYWKRTAGPLKVYLSLGVSVLMLITSVGIYGYLSSAYAQVASAPQATINQIDYLGNRQQTIDQEIARLTQDNQTLETRQRQAQQSLDNVLAGNTELNQRSAFANLRQEIADLDNERQANNARLLEATSQKDSLGLEKTKLTSDLNTSSKLGTFIYVSRALGIPLDSVVKWFVLVLVFVFDPLAVSLILAYNSIVVHEQEENSTKKKKPASRPATKKKKKATTKPKPTSTVQSPKSVSSTFTKVETRKERPASLKISTAPSAHLSVEAVGSEPTTPEIPFYRVEGYDWDANPDEWKHIPDAVHYYRQMKNMSY